MCTENVKAHKLPETPLRFAYFRERITSTNGLSGTGEQNTRTLGRQDVGTGSWLQASRTATALYLQPCATVGHVLLTNPTLEFCTARPAPTT
jgi:hypothetical protein